MKPNADSKPSRKPRLGFRHILVPTDLTERTEKALQLAGKLAVADSSRITVVHVVETIGGLEFDELKPFYERLKRKAHSDMTDLVRQAPAKGAECAVVYGRPAEEIVGFATAHDVDLIVLASHRVNPAMVNRDWGTISYKVGILAQCPVLLMK